MRCVIVANMLIGNGVTRAVKTSCDLKNDTYCRKYSQYKNMMVKDDRDSFDSHAKS